MKKFLLIILFFSSFSFSQDLKKADELYKNSNFNEALKIYLSYEKTYPLNSDLLYNIGNCYYKLDNPSLSLVYYLRSFKINPRNNNLWNNLLIVLKNTGNNLFSNDIPLEIYKIYFFLSDYEIKALINISFWIFSLSLTLFLIKNKDYYKNIIFLSLIFFIFSLMFYIIRKNSIIYNSAVITTNEARVMSGPGENFKLLATTSNSKIVRILTENSDWFEIGFQEESLKGWIKSTDLIKI